MRSPRTPWMPIGELARRTGASPERLRKWERRYALLVPARTSGNRRLYSQEDQARVELMLRQIATGMPAARAAQLVVEERSGRPLRPTRAVVERAAAGARNVASFRNSFVPMLVADDERRYVDANAAACLLLRLSRPEILRLRIDDLTPPGLEDVTASLWEAFVREGTQSGTFELATPDGARLTVDYSAKANLEPGRHLSMLYFPLSPQRAVPKSTERRRHESLSEREREVLTLVAMGAQGPSIAVTLGLSAATVQSHLRRAMKKLGAKNPAHAIALGLQREEIAISFATSQQTPGGARSDGEEV
jgi:DNA-binding CsgD family transcriptional regulator/DNA-binding transcriptional MerR regulator